MARAMYGPEDSIVSKSEPLQSHRGFLSRSLGWLIGGIWVVCQIVLIAWGTLAIYYSNLPWGEPRLALAAAFAAFSVWACLGVASTRHVRGFSRRIFRSGGLVDFNRSVTRSSMATGSGGDAASDHRW
jgi:hypothetical protein